MNDPLGRFLFYLVFGVPCQALFAAVGALVILPLVQRLTGRPYLRLLSRFLLVNALLLFWGAFGNACWLYLTDDRVAVLDDAPVWSPVVPLIPLVFDRAAGGRDGWQLLGGATFPQLQFFWAATVLPVWIFAGLSFYIYTRRSRFAARSLLG